ncbi:hypothetical protein lerEdw1_016454, partial [Lerista edwardsae]
MPTPGPERCKASHFLFRFPGKASFEFPTRGAAWEEGGAEPEPDLDLPGGGHQVLQPLKETVSFSEAETAETWQRPLLRKIKLENDWESTSREGDEMVCRDENDQPESSRELKPYKILADRLDESISHSTDQEEISEIQEENLPKKEGNLFIHSQGTYEELQDIVMPREISRGFGEVIPAVWGECY